MATEEVDGITPEVSTILLQENQLTIIRRN